MNSETTAVWKEDKIAQLEHQLKDARKDKRALKQALINVLEHREGTEEGNKARKEAELLIQKIRGHE
jgi:hypothetical protein